MAVTVDVDGLLRSTRAVDSAEVRAELAELLEYATVEVVRIAPTAPTAIHNRAVVMVVSQLYDRPTSTRGTGHANVLRNSGAQSVLLPYRAHRAGTT